MIEYVNLFLLLTFLRIIYYICYKYKLFLHAINIVIDSVTLHQLNDLEKDTDSEVKVIKTKVWQEIKCYFCILPDILGNIGSILRK